MKFNKLLSFLQNNNRMPYAYKLHVMAYATNVAYFAENHVLFKITFKFGYSWLNNACRNGGVTSVGMALPGMHY